MLTTRPSMHLKGFVDQLESHACYNPHHRLGLHQVCEETQVIRVFRPGASFLYLEIEGEQLSMRRVDERGLFECVVGSDVTVEKYQVYHPSGFLSYDPYAFFPTFGEWDAYLFNNGVHYHLYDVLGGRACTHQGIEGVAFAVWAPSAKQVSLVGDFNHWNGTVNPMRSMGASGVWELFVPGLTEGEKYKFEIFTQNGERCLKQDPMGLRQELRPGTASVVANYKKFSFNDGAYLKKREAERFEKKPMTIYEVHLGSWKRGWQGKFFNYRTLAHELADYCSDMGFTHVELMPILEHPLDESWGYQVTGFFAPTSRHGELEDFQYFVNHLHLKGIGVILDWVPAHFPTDNFSLARFDGTALYEHDDPKQGFHPHWNTLIFNYGRKEVSNFLIASALFWLKEMHVDGLRVDAVASMLYLDYGRDEGEWIPNVYGGRENLEAIEFIKHLNSVIHQRVPGALMVAEESTAFTGVTHSVEGGGLGFDMKWNMGWMNDTLAYFCKNPVHRSYHQSNLTFGMLYAYSEKFSLVLSHDEVVHGKGSLLSKMPGDTWQQFANLRLLYSYMICQVGKKLLFMGAEFGMWNEWSCAKEIDWLLLTFPVHDSVKTMIKELNHLYLEKGCLWEKDFEPEGFSWVAHNDSDNSVIAYIRKGTLDQALCVHNFTPNYYGDYYLPLANVEEAKEIFNSDSEKFGGSGKENGHARIVYDARGWAVGLHVQLAPLATMIFDVRWV